MDSNIIATKYTSESETEEDLYYNENDVNNENNDGKNNFDKYTSISSEPDIDDYVTEYTYPTKMSNLSSDVINKNIIDSEGLSIGDYNMLNKDSKTDLYLCNICGKYYKNDMILDSNEPEPQCLHCFYWLNSTMEVRNKIDGFCGKYIVDYIIKCRDTHVIDNCTRNSDQGGCFVCLHLLGIEIDGLKNAEKLVPKLSVSDHKDEIFCYDQQDDDISDELSADEYKGFTIDI